MGKTTAISINDLPVMVYLPLDLLCSRCFTYISVYLFSMLLFCFAYTVNALSKSQRISSEYIMNRKIESIKKTEHHIGYFIIKIRHALYYGTRILKPEIYVNINLPFISLLKKCYFLFRELYF